MDRDELAYWVGFNVVSGIGPVRFRALRRHFPDLREAWEAEHGELRRAGLDQRAIASLLRARETLSLEEELDKIQRAGARAITWEDEEYPPRLQHIYAPPPVLYIKGRLRPEDEWALAVVGTRRPTPYGRAATRRLVESLARHGIAVVSGLAWGIDTEGHSAALSAGGRTIAVLGSGIDVIYPSEHRHIAERIVEHGAVISECPMGTAPAGKNFPARNRIISGMSLGTLVVEAPRGSGALITAQYALQQGREVFAVPGSIFNPASDGTNRLIQNGAKLVLSIEDILEELNLVAMTAAEEVRKVVPASEEEALLLEHLSIEPVHIDEMSRASGMAAAQVSSTLTLMELKGLVREVGGMCYVLA